jgi:hypothetical protein
VIRLRSRRRIAGTENRKRRSVPTKDRSTSTFHATGKEEFEPVIVPKHKREFKGSDDKILSMYSRGMTTREIAGHLKEIYGTDVSPELISRATDSVKITSTSRTVAKRPLRKRLSPEDRRSIRRRDAYAVLRLYKENGDRAMAFSPDKI